MRQNTLLLVSVNYPAQNSIKKYLESVFRGHLIIEACLCSQVSDFDLEEYSLILFSSADAQNRSRLLLGQNAAWKTCHRIIDFNQLDRMLDITPGREIYLVNDNEESAIEVISQLEALGITQYRFVPCYPGSPPPDGTDCVAVTVGESHLVPRQISHVVDIGSRNADMSTICEIVTHFDLPLSLVNDVVHSYNRHITKLLTSSISQVGAIYKTQQITQVIMQNMESGVCLADAQGNIEMVNENFYRMLALPKRDIIGRALDEVLLRNGICENITYLTGGSRVVVNRKGQSLVAEVRAVGETAVGDELILTVDYTEDITSKEIVIRRKARDEKNQRHYHFEDYITQDEEVNRFLERAKKIAAFDSDVLIQGESGTGKEIIAQSIHESSHRKNQPFVPVNLAAIQPNLLESELFGYEEGSFTGAKKGGKKGLFEQAHRGTIFLDEIGDAPMSFQTKLLRTLQERDVRRVGGSQLIPIDVRVIAATNKNLYEQVRKGAFRQDLFFRISVFPLETLALRRRRDDIRPLLNHCARNYFNNDEIQIDDVCSDQLLRFFQEYDWPGNVRELMNICRYFSCVASPSEKMQISDLPEYMLSVVKEQNETGEVKRAVLSVLQAHPKAGRAKIVDYLGEKRIQLSQGQVRGLLKELAEEELIHVNRTRGGCELTEKAAALLSR